MSIWVIFLFIAIAIGTGLFLTSMDDYEGDYDDE